MIFNLIYAISVASGIILDLKHIESEIVQDLFLNANQECKSILC